MFLRIVNRRTIMHMPSFLASTAFAAVTALGTSAALAGPTVLGVTLPDQFYFDTTTSYETLVTAQSPGLSGVFQVNNIRDQNTSVISWNNGDNGAFLTGYFTGFTLASVTPGATATTLRFTGGTLSYYRNNSNTFTNSSGTVAGDIAAASAGTLWLQLTPEVTDAAGTTLSITLNGLNPTTTSFTSSNAFALADVSGGAAAPFLDSNAFPNLFTGGLADIVFSGSATQSSAGACGADFQVCGSNNASALVATPVPEPVTLSIFGAGLVGAAALRRRRAK
jgi:hypothetical protein